MILSIVAAQFRDADPEAFTRAFGSRTPQESAEPPPKESRGAVIGAFALLAGTLTIPAFAAFVLSAPAKADPVDTYTAHYAGSICEALNERPELDTITRLMDGMVVDGYGQFRGRIMLDSVSGWCPEYSGLIDDYVAAYLPRTTTNTIAAARRMGGIVS